MYLDVNPAFEDATGLKAKDIIGKLFRKDIVKDKEEGQSLDFCIKLSAGLSNFPSVGNSIKVLMHKGDYMMYKIKRTGKNGFDFYQEND